MQFTTRKQVVIGAALAIMLGAAAVHATPRHRQHNYRRPNTVSTQARTNQQPRMDGLQARLESFIRQNRCQTFTKHGKKFVGVQRNANMDGYKNLGKNMVEFFVRPGFHHLYARVPKTNNGQLQQHVYSRITGLSRSSWYKSTSEQVSVLCQLTDKEMGNLNKFLDRAVANPREVIGKFVYGGRPPTASNCTSYITTAKVGERGESLARILGVYESGMPQGFLRSLISRGNSRVKAVVIHNPSGGNFDQNYDLNRALR